MDPFGNARFSQSVIRLVRSGEMARHQVKSADGNIADGKTPSGCKRRWGPPFANGAHEGWGNTAGQRLCYILNFMQVHLVRRLICGAAALAFCAQLCAQQTSDTFRWIDFHSPKDQNIVAWVTRSMQVEDWTAIREIGVEYDAALVVTSDRTNPQAPPSSDTFTIWNVSLTSHVVAPLLKGVSLRWLDWEHFEPGKPEELTMLYDNCSNCAASTYFTALYYDLPHHMWAARWIRGGQGALAWSAVPQSSSGIVWTQVYAELSGSNGVAELCTWNHFDFGKLKPPSNTYFLLRCGSSQRPGPDGGSDGQRERGGNGAAPLPGPGRGAGCGAGPGFGSLRAVVEQGPQRKPATTPPANNIGHSSPPGGRH